MLRKETIEPAKQEAEGLVVEAHSRADKILRKAQEDAETLLRDARDGIEQERRVFESSLTQACRQGVERLRQDVEHKLFDEGLYDLIVGATKDADIVATLINTIVTSLEKEGLEGDLSAIIPAAVPAEKVNALLLDNVVARLKEGEILLGTFDGGAKVRLHDKRLVIDISDGALKELLGRYLRKDFRETLFKS